MSKRHDEKDLLREITPSEYMCGVGSCPSVFETEHGTVVVIGKIPDESLRRRLPPGKIGKDEFAVEISRDLIAKIGR